MVRMNPIQQSKFIEYEYRKYLKSSFQFGNDEYQKCFNDELEKAVLYKGPFINLTLPFTTNHSIRQLIEQGKIHPDFAKLGKIKLDQTLYWHQEESLRKIEEGRSLVITTGTGSGKTESFLYPILNKIMKDKSSGKDQVGIRAMLLYPMNALVNDQIDRVRDILSSYPNITYGFFTGDTKEKLSKPERKTIEEENGYEIPPNELITREEIRSTPPDLLFTNYSMLEYLLIRPKDFDIFDANRLQNWNFIVLDEAHTYNGALGIEIAMLLRRVTALAPKCPQFILTSATLGQEGESEDEIVNFAKNLTSKDFKKSDIIFARRDQLKYDNFKFFVDANDYISLDENFDDMENVKTIASKYMDVSKCISASEYLYELLSRDINVYNLYHYLKDGSLEFKDLLYKFEGTDLNNEKALVALIHLVNIARKNHKMIYDLKYHTFIRSLKGAFVTLGKNKVLKLANTTEVDGKKAFEIGNCKYCDTPYIIGKIENGYLLQNNEIDIYENYGEMENVGLDYFIFKQDIEEDKITKNTIDGEYLICSKCGKIIDAKDLNSEKCSCDDTEYIEVYKIKNNRKNNIAKCPCCGKGSKQAGIVRTINLGKDEGTALLAQTLYQAIDDGSEEKVTIKKLGFGKKQEVTKKTKAKQFLAFSDSRQQASFFKVFFQSNHERFLSKRLIWEVIKDNNYNKVKVGTLATSLEDLINEKHLFNDEFDAYKRAWIILLTELLSIDGIYGAEGLGIFNFELDVEKYIKSLETEAIIEFMKNTISTRQEFIDLVRVLFDTFRTASAIKYSQSELTPELRKEYLNYRRFNNFIKLNNEVKAIDGIKDTSVRSFLPVKNSNTALDYMMKVTKLSKEVCLELLTEIFDVCGVEANIFTKQDGQPIYQIDADKYVLNNYKKTKYYKCNKCGKVTPYNVKEVCPQNKCDGQLIEIEDVDENLGGSYYREQYLTKKIEPLVVEEHTAQIERKAAKKYQKDFKDKKINVLSCSTTFEMGVDIGDLETVFLRNVPPTPANYVQRAGRAGRSEDSSAFVLTFCGATSHDYTYFDDPTKMISGIIRPPHFEITNEKIIVRHLIAVALGYFFRKNPEYFVNVESLIFKHGIEAFLDMLQNDNEEIRNVIDTKILPESIYATKYHDMNWYKNKLYDENKIKSYMSEYIDKVNVLEKAISEASSDGEHEKAAYYSRVIAAIKCTKVIDSLSSNGIIPKYGFPVDSVNLDVYENGIYNSKIELSRDLSIAISEYAPESEVVADGKKYTSKYITLPSDKHFTKYYYSTCEKCRHVNVSIVPSEIKECPHCGHVNEEQVVESFIIPSLGFKTGENKESTRMKPKRSYAGEVSYIGGGKIENTAHMTNLLSIESAIDDQLLVMNSSSFYMCPVCGFSVIDRENKLLPQITEEHYNFKGIKCHETVLNRVKLGHLFKTDVAHFYIEGITDINKAISFLYALLEGISIEFNIERNDINGLVQYNANTLGYDIIVFDNVPGGAGHVKRLINKDSLKQSLISAKMKVSQDCCDENTSCYNCLRNYYNQKYHNRIKRKYALEVINMLLSSFNTMI